MPKELSGKHLLLAFGAGAVLALCLPKMMLCLLGTGLLLTAAYALHRYFSSDITDKEN